MTNPRASVSYNVFGGGLYRKERQTHNFKEEHIMKSFTKKLAFVMALAMVVTLAAPVAANTYAATTIKYAEQNAAETDTQASVKLFVGGKIDMKFIGAPSNWESIFNGWKSANEKIATVDRGGLITAVAPGTTTVWVDLGSAYTGKLTVVVEEVKEYKIQQITESAIKVDFGDYSLTTNDLNDRLTFTYNIRPNSAIKYPVRVTEVKNGVASISLYANLKDGKNYTLTYNGKSGSFDAHIGKVDHIVIEDNSDKALIERGEDSTEIAVTAKLMNQYGVDITNTAIAKDQADVVFEVIDDGSELAEDADISVDDDLNKATLRVGNGTVKVKVSFYDGTEVEDADGNVEVPLTASNIKSIKATVRDEYEVINRLAATIVKAKGSFVVDEDLPSADTKDEKWKNDLTVCVGDMVDNFQLTALYSDNSSTEKVLTFDPKTKGTFRFESTDTNKLFVRNDGTVFAYEANGNSSAKVQVLVFFTPDEEGGEGVEDIVDVIDITVRPKRSASSDKSVLAKSEGKAYILGHDEGSIISGQNFVKVAYTSKDQYGDAFPVKASDIKIVADTSKFDTKTKAPTATIYKKGEDVQADPSTVASDWVIVFEASAASKTEKKATNTQFKYKISLNGGSKSYTLTVYRVKDENGKEVDKGIYVVEWTGLTDNNGKFDARMTNASNLDLTGTCYRTVNGAKVEKIDLYSINFTQADADARVTLMKSGTVGTFTEDETAAVGPMTTADNKEVAAVATAMYTNKIDADTDEVTDLVKNNRFIVSISKKAANGQKYNNYLVDDGNVVIPVLKVESDGTAPVVQYADELGGIGSYAYSVFTLKNTDKDIKGTPTSTFTAISMLKNSKGASVEVINTTTGFLGGQRSETSSYHESGSWGEDTYVEIAKECFKYSWSNGKTTFNFAKGDDFETTADSKLPFGNIIVTVDHNGPTSPEAGDVVYINSVTFYVPVGANDKGEYVLTGTSAYNKSTVKVNKFVNVK